MFLSIPQSYVPAIHDLSMTLSTYPDLCFYPSLNLMCRGTRPPIYLSLYHSIHISRTMFLSIPHSYVPRMTLSTYPDLCFYPSLHPMCPGTLPSIYISLSLCFYRPLHLMYQPSIYLSLFPHISRPMFLSIPPSYVPRYSAIHLYITITMFLSIPPSYVPRYSATHISITLSTHIQTYVSIDPSIWCTQVLSHPYLSMTIHIYISMFLSIPQSYVLRMTIHTYLDLCFYRPLHPMWPGTRPSIYISVSLCFYPSLHPMCPG